MSDNKAVAVRDIRTDINNMEEQFKMALPQHIPSAKFVRTTLTAIQNNPDLLNADRQSVLSSCMKAAQDGLVLDGREAALVIFNSKDGDNGWVKKAQYMPMVAGIMKKARNSGEISTISAHVAYDKDRFLYILGDEEKVVHEPFMGGERGKPIAAYAIVRLKDGSVQREVMPVADIEAIRSRSKSAKSGPWVSDWAEMARKTVLRRIAKYVPSSTDKENGNNLLELTSRDDELYDLSTGEIQETETPRGRKQKAAAGILEVVPVTIDHQPTQAEALAASLDTSKTEEKA